MKTIAILFVLFAGACESGPTPVCVETDSGECVEPVYFPQDGDTETDGQVLENPDSPPAPIVAAPQE